MAFGSSAFWLILAVPAAALVAGLALAQAMPWLRTYALAHPNARSSHVAPTPQGGGIVVVATVILLALAAALLKPEFFATASNGIALAAAALLALIGAADDRHGLPVAPRLLAQAIAVVAIVGSLPETARLLPAWPLAFERALLIVIGIGFVNAVNFMDGLDWMTVAEIVPVTAVLAALTLAGNLATDAGLLMAALCGALIGFAPYNRPVARLFLGDVGSLPIGLLTGYGLLALALEGHGAAALLLPLYYLADAGLTLLRRLARGEKPWQAHRSHFYQRATDRGHSVMTIVTTVAVLNVALGALAAWTVWMANRTVDAVALAAGVIATVLVLWRFTRAARQLPLP